MDKIERLSSAVSIDPSAPSTSAAPASVGVSARAPARTRWWVEILTVGWLAWMYDAINNLAPLRLHAALAHAQGILDLEHSLHIDPELTLDRWLAGHQTFGLVVSYYYDNAHFVVTFGLLGWLWWKRVDLYKPLRNSLVLVNVLGLLVFWRYPVAPPRMLDGFTDVIAQTHAFGGWHTGSLASHANEVGAMPSLHIAWALWCTAVVWRLSSRAWLRALAIAYPCATAFAVMCTGNHFVLDILGGAAAIAASMGLVALFGRAGSGANWITGHAGADFPQFPTRLRSACHKLVTKSKIS